MGSHGMNSGMNSGVIFRLMCRYFWGLVVAMFVLTAGVTDMEASAEGRNRRHKTVYTVIPGDTLSKIAKRHKVKTRDLRRWNRLKSDLLTAGKTLVVYTKEEIPDQGVRFHKVKAGETFKGIAKKHKVSAGDLISWNPRLDPRKLRVGDKVTMYYDKPKPKGKRSKRGRFDGVQLPPGKGYRVRNGDRAWGTARLVKVLSGGLKATKKKYKRKASDLVVGDLSTRRGGYLPPHKSHRTGRDADVAYYIKKTDTSWRFIRATPKTLDVEKTWYLLHQYLKTGKVKYIFVNYELQKPLYEYAKKQKGVSKRKLNAWFQYPVGRKNGSRAIIRHSPGHDDHFHLRVTCSRHEKNCRN